jgi:hypothetical protein
VPTSGGRCRSPRRRAFVRQHCSCWPAGEYMDPWPVYPGARRIDRRRTWRQPGRSAFSGHAHPRRGREQSCRAAVRARVRARPRIFPVPSPHRTAPSRMLIGSRGGDSYQRATGGKGRPGCARGIGFHSPQAPAA